MLKKSVFILITFLFVGAAFFPEVSLAGGIDFPTSEETGLSDLDVLTILENVLDWLLTVVGIIALIGFVVSGVQYILAAGDEKRMEAGKRNMIYSIIGIAIVLGSYVVIEAIDGALNGYSYF